MPERRSVALLIETSKTYGRGLLQVESAATYGRTGLGRSSSRSEGLADPLPAWLDGWHG
jgi:hypothetical protein